MQIAPYFIGVIFPGIRSFGSFRVWQPANFSLSRRSAIKASANWKKNPQWRSPRSIIIIFGFESLIWFDVIAELDPVDPLCCWDSISRYGVDGFEGKWWNQWVENPIQRPTRCCWYAAFDISPLDSRCDWRKWLNCSTNFFSDIKNTKIETLENFLLHSLNISNVTILKINKKNIHRILSFFLFYIYSTYLKIEKNKNIKNIDYYFQCMRKHVFVLQNH